MTVRFLDVANNQCRTPVSGTPGPDMLVCGAPVLPGRTCCAKCRRKLYYRPTVKARAAVDRLALKATDHMVRKQGSSLPAKDLDDFIGRL